MNINIINVNENTKTKYNERIKDRWKKIMSSEAYEDLELALLSHSRYEEICSKITEITDKPVWEDYNFKCGKVFGILRSIANSPKQRKELLEVTGLNTAIIEMYLSYCGNLPYLDNKGMINPGRPMNPEMAKNTIMIAATMLGMDYPDDAYDDITEYRWNKLYEYAMRRAEDTKEQNMHNKEVEYEE